MMWRNPWQNYLWTLELCDISPVWPVLLQYGQVNLHAWKVHVLLFSHGDVIHDLTTYPFRLWYLLLESTNTADGKTSKNTRPLLSQNHLHSFSPLRTMIHQPPEWCYLHHCKPRRASLITTVKGLAWQLWATAGRTRPRWCHHPESTSSPVVQGPSALKHQLYNLLRINHYIFMTCHY